MKLKNIIFLSFLFIFIFMVFGCKKKDPTKTQPKEESEKTMTEILIVSYYDEGILTSKERYTKETFSLPAPTKEGSNFLGWFLDSEFNTKFNESELDNYFKLGRIDLYASWEQIRNNYVLSAYGKLGNDYVPNPAFTWDNPYNDQTFIIKLFKNGEEIVNEETNNLYYLAPLLDYNTNYKFYFEGKDSNNFKELEFKTIANKDYANKEIVIDNPFMDNCVIQRDQIINLTGIGPEAKLIITKFGSELHFGVAGEDGRFDVEIPAHYASFDPIDITFGIGLENQVTLTNVLIGDVYFFSGQSNMQWPTMSSDFLFDDVTRAKNANVRFFTQNVVTSTEPLEYATNARWFACDDSNYAQYSAICFMTGALLGEKLKEEYVPLGILSAYQGDTNIANWMSQDYYTGSVSTKYLHYNAMVYPLRHTKIKGVVWYQGCNNSAAGGDYYELLLKLFANYRDLFDNETLPFYVIGLACYDGDSGNNYDFSYVRESQAKACEADSNAYFISTCDDGDPTFIHPKHKRYIALRVMKSILSTQYERAYLPAGPTYKSHTVNGNKVIIEFDYADGLYASSGITNLYLAGSDGKYYLAYAYIEGTKLVASSSKVSAPVYIKYGFGKSPFVNIFNKDDFSMVPFRTDDHNIDIDLLEYNDISKYTFHPDGSKMNISYDTNGLKITKTGDGKTYGSVRLDKWGMISYGASGFRFSVIGQNSKATIAFRAIEGPTFEVWGYSIVDNFTGLKTFEIGLNDFKCILNKNDNKFNTQNISYIEIMVEKSGEASFIVNEARFIQVERTKPRDFTIDTVTFNGDNAVVSLNKALFGDSYSIKVSDKKDFSNILFEDRKDDTVFTFDVSNYTKGIPYYIKATAYNELGEVNSLNDGFVFYINDENTLIINNFDYDNQAQLDSYIASNMKVHSALNCILLDDQSIKIESNGGGWQNFIFVIETGSNAGKNKLQFDADFTNYKGTVVLEIVDPSWQIFVYNLDLSVQKSGTFTIDLENYISKDTKKPFNGEKLMWVSFNFNDTTGNGYILFDNCKLIK